MSVCLHDRTKTVETTIIKLATRADSPSWVLSTRLILGQKVKDKGHRVTKCKNIFQFNAIDWPTWVCTLSSAYHVRIGTLFTKCGYVSKYSGLLSYDLQLYRNAYVIAISIMPPTSVGKGHYKMMAGVCLSVCPCRLDLTRERKA